MNPKRPRLLRSGPLFVRSLVFSPASRPVATAARVAAGTAPDNFVRSLGAGSTVNFVLPESSTRCRTACSPSGMTSPSIRRAE